MSPSPVAEIVKIALSPSHLVRSAGLADISGRFSTATSVVAIDEIQPCTSVTVTVYVPAWERVAEGIVGF